MAKPCKKIKNPCKICLGPVTRKNGLQCQGFCQCWVHYACLNYTPGKIKDIKAGIILVNCPCPDCTSTQPKEYRSDEPFSCTNLQCPANIAPKCENTGCPINKQQDQKEGGNTKNTGAGSNCPLGQCGKECKENSNGSNQPGKQKAGNSCGPSCKETSVPLKAGAVLPHQMPQSPQSPPFCESGCSLPPGDLGQSSDPMPALEQMCNTVGQLTNQINDLMQQMKNVVQGNNNGGGPGRNPKESNAKSCYCPGNPGKRR